VLGTRFTEMFGLTAPVMSAPMLAHSGGRLAGAVSAGGGLGAFAGMHRQLGPEWIREQAALVRSITDGPFAIGFITAFLAPANPLVAAAIEERPAAICFSFGDPAPWTGAVRAAGVKVICQVQDHATAETALAAGADVLVVQGTEAGGHTGAMSLLPLLAGVVARHPDVPVLAAGGISDGRTLAAALVAGADGAMLGTAFLATPEAVEVDERYKRLIVDSDGGDTVLTHAYDIVSGLPWPGFVSDRVRRNRFTDAWEGRDEELRARRDEVAAAQPTGDGLDPDVDAVRYGQSAAFVDAIRPAAEVIRDLTAGAADVLAARPRGR
jgi:nitronate monooxygenase